MGSLLYRPGRARDGTDEEPPPGGGAEGDPTDEGGVVLTDEAGNPLTDEDPE